VKRQQEKFEIANKKCDAHNMNMAESKLEALNWVLGLDYDSVIKTPFKEAHPDKEKGYCPKCKRSKPISEFDKHMQETHKWIWDKETQKYKENS
jgi:hypothetical protein